MSKTDKCIYCKRRYKLPSFERGEIEEGRCFSCQILEKTVLTISQTLGYGSNLAGDSVEFWRNELKKLTKL